ncbi:hypothetical protein EN833_12085 [Mesorhizobium sp. M4B.F.Ca.ET.190.01.1.1]|nr:hypothetical protein EN779_04660 [Mesorhizobium sp. M4B.F.Ca.ET.088.02.2.1]RWF32027.1 MAG: hypothetical protein EOS45_07980 [Mesorhizobium sp.]TGQ41435.1 hypothetical protein EN857_06795 [Mesorhizobium sp. M4B.F.Ca.ET.214.01.1.1]TGQ61363.1 hypothetical protein EN854_06800 [Mesorhizobium sp. M4B.F.Ca.ET.211.01.1.1]TGR12208.1 hypothetical protein EN843_12080 [Mesorhizobium sp. M4B.F.Ca.ET.200.01.1.1]TGS20525.1 hypothetical protein EN833_12085 [Mesorhizobium sp. M4B.F.Ca.ET.190.01.1.1]TGT3194
MAMPPLRCVEFQVMPACKRRLSALPVLTDPDLNLGTPYAELRRGGEGASAHSPEKAAGHQKSGSRVADRPVRAVDRDCLSA